MQKHPSDAELIRAALEEPSAETRAHLAAGCKRCEQRMRELQAVKAALSAPPLEEVPPELTAQASAWLAKQTEHPLRKIFEEVRAVLVLDSLSGPLLAGIRGGAPSTGRQLLYESSAGDLHLQIDPADGGALVQGQFLPVSPEPATGRAVLLGTPTTTTCPLSENGEFRFERFGQQMLHLQIEWGDQRILIDPIELEK